MICGEYDRFRAGAVRVQQAHPHVELFLVWTGPAASITLDVIRTRPVYRGRGLAEAALPTSSPWPRNSGFWNLVPGSGVEGGEGRRCVREGWLVDPQGWWGVLLQGTISAVVGGLVAALTAWAVVSATRRHERHTALRAEARASAVRMYHLAGEMYGALCRLADGEAVPVPTTEGREWLVNATGLEIAMFALDGDLGARMSQDLGEARRALERLNVAPESRDESAQVAAASMLRLCDSLADWLMDGRHRAATRTS
ncbi:hypothetical protein [Actinomadura rudentiformis]|uniref:Uncharacterized protein n=1 Tax=Actinomadura rudentiformis TaxID=359158 RepID=A0A6H9Z7Q2_9ACTN|nr:hypothetical protein [Actinomadura rudentiformis]KAB2350006.1 hypothetical protein F8566_09220 [Actinomadura rudentiformis]